MLLFYYIVTVVDTAIAALGGSGDSGNGDHDINDNDTMTMAIAVIIMSNDSGINNATLPLAFPEEARPKK